MPFQASACRAEVDRGSRWVTELPHTTISEESGSSLHLHMGSQLLPEVYLRVVVEPNAIHPSPQYPLQQVPQRHVYE